jgi:predicted ATP-binding protein involved in virulence
MQTRRITVRIIKFTGSKLHGYLNLKVKFKKDLTFLTGINGSGKTTVVKAVAALTTPSLYNLTHMNFDIMEVEISQEESKAKIVKIRAEKKDDSVSLSTSTTDEKLPIPFFRADPTDPSMRAREKENDYYKEFETEYANHPVLKNIRNLAKPMVLGIERRFTEFVTDDVYPVYRARRRYPIDQTNPLGISLIQAADLADSAFRKVQVQQAKITEELKKKVLLDAFLYQEGFAPSIRELDIAEVFPARDIPSTKRNFLATFQRLGLSSQELEARLEAFFKKTTELSNILKNENDFSKLLGSKDPEKSGAVIELILNYPQFNRIARLLNFVEENVEESKKANEPIDRYLNIVNSFLADSKKEIRFDETGSLVVGQLGGTNSPITSLSSGESQILVIITHLALNPSAQAANVFIVDEPELSLHVRWQEIFVEAVQKANPNLQIILATHSPSIILDRTNNCIDLSGR